MTAAAPTDPSPTSAPHPFLKWAGSKRASAAAILDVLPERIVNYYEPMLGGGAVFFALRAAGRIDGTPHLTDINAELVTTFRIVRDEITPLIRELSQHAYSRDVFEAWKAKDPTLLTPLACATRMIYLNRTCFNGLYRLNMAGRFNVPFGRYTNPTICQSGPLQEASNALRGAALAVGDYRGTYVILEPTEPWLFQEPATGDAVYFDPPYVPLSHTSNFTSYTQGRFGRKAHEALATRFAELAQRGVAVALSNSDTPFTRELYRGFQVRSIMVRRAINSRAAKRGAVGEILVTANCRGD